MTDRTPERPTGPASALVLVTSRRRSVWLSLGGAMFVAVAIVILILPATEVRQGFGLNSHVWSVLSLVFFGFGFVLALRDVIRPRHIATIDAHGIQTLGRKGVQVPWPAVARLQQSSTFGTVFLYVHAHDPAAFPPSARRFGLPATVVAAVTLTGNTIKPAEAMRWVSGYAAGWGIPVTL